MSNFCMLGMGISKAAGFLQKTGIRQIAQKTRKYKENFLWKKFQKIVVIPSEILYNNSCTCGLRVFSRALIPDGSAKALKQLRPQGSGRVRQRQIPPLMIREKRIFRSVGEHTG